MHPASVACSGHVDASPDVADINVCILRVAGSRGQLSGCTIRLPAELCCNTDAESTSRRYAVHADRLDRSIAPEINSLDALNAALVSWGIHPLR